MLWSNPWYHQVDKASQVLSYLDKAVGAYSAWRSAGAPGGGGGGAGAGAGADEQAVGGTTGGLDSAPDLSQLACYGFKSLEDLRVRPFLSALCFLEDEDQLVCTLLS